MFQTNLKRLREIKGVSQAQLAKAIDVGVSTVGMWENGKNKPDNINAQKIADYFGVSISELYADEHQTYATDMNDDDLKFALLDGEKGLTDEQLAEVKRFAKFVTERDSKKVSP